MSAKVRCNDDAAMRTLRGAGCIARDRATTVQLVRPGDDGCNGSEKMSRKCCLPFVGPGVCEDNGINYQA